MDKLLKKRIRLTKLVSTLIYSMPFVSCVILNGSLAQGKINAQSDIDLLLISKKGRIFTARFFAVALVWIIGLKRSSDEKKFHGGKFCLNYFLSNNFLKIPHNREEKINRYCAENYSQAILVIGDDIVFKKFIDINIKWMKRYLKSQKTPIYREYPVKKSLLFFVNPIKKVSECLLGGNIGIKLEKLLKYFQLKKIMRDKRTSMYPDLIVVNDYEMRFHPPKSISKKY